MITKTAEVTENCKNNIYYYESARAAFENILSE